MRTLPIWASLVVICVCAAGQTQQRSLSERGSSPSYIHFSATPKNARFAVGSPVKIKLTVTNDGDKAVYVPPELDIPSDWYIEDVSPFPRVTVRVFSQKKRLSEKVMFSDPDISFVFENVTDEIKKNWVLLSPHKDFTREVEIKAFPQTQGEYTVELTYYSRSFSLEQMKSFDSLDNPAFTGELRAEPLKLTIAQDR